MTLKKTRYLLGALFLILFLSGCNVGDLFKTDRDEALFTAVTEMKQHVEKEEWMTVRAKMDTFQTNYDNQKWKMQLLGELEDYHDIELEIKHFYISAEEEDAFECLIGLEQIAYRLHTIYTL